MPVNGGIINGDMIKGSGPKVYLVEAGQRRWIPDPATLDSLGGWGRAKTVSDDSLNAVPEGEPILTVGPTIISVDLSISPLALNQITPRVFSVDPMMTADTLARLQHHKAVLQSFGVNELSSLGKLSIAGTVVPQSGLLKPAQAGLLKSAAEIYEAEPTMFQQARRATLDGKALETIGGTARLLKTIPFPTTPPPNDSLAAPLVPIYPEPRSFTTMAAAPAPGIQGTKEISDAYWAATSIDIADNTVLVFKQPNMYLTIITEKLTVGKNVTITWEPEPPKELPKKLLPKPDKPPQAPTPNGLWGVTGDPGISGQPGGKGPDGKDAPELELWTLAMTGSPIFDLKGQNGFQGGEGQDGGDGGDGSKGRMAQPEGIWGFCQSGPGNGGNGGDGGVAGNGGLGGNGGHGGRLNLYAPQPILNVYAQGFLATVDGGAGGPGGMPGVPGAGGDGGEIGDNPHMALQFCSHGHVEPGSQGGQGVPGKQGSSGYRGDKYNDAISLKPIDADDFRRKLLEPAIIRLSPTDVKEGDTVTATGLRYTATDVVHVEGVACATTVMSDTQLTFKVPAVEGRYRAVQVRQTDGTLSNRATLNVLPVIRSTQPTGRIRPGTNVTLIGSGFSPGCLVRVNGQDMPNVRFINGTALEFTLIRPAVITPNPAGEEALLKVILRQGTSSNEISLVLDTFRMLVMGDSILWGQGLQENEKIHTLVKQAIQQREGKIGVYTEVLAHSGAIIGIEKNRVESRIDGEVPTPYPTILQQCADFNDKPETVDLILVDGGINDIGIEGILAANNSEQLRDLTEKRCHQHMKTLLERITSKFKNAKIVVTGYYPIISEQSDLLLVQAFLAGIGINVQTLLAGLGIGIPDPLGNIVLGLAAKSKLAANCQVFAEQSAIKLKAAVDEVNDSLMLNAAESRARVFLAVPDFDGNNAALAPAPWIYGINLDLSPQDYRIAGGRRIACELAAAVSRTNLEICKRASVGHPNPAGAQAYAEAINTVLFEKPVPEFIGFADLHCHPMFHLGFGGKLMAGLPDGPIDQALGWCTPTHGPGGTGLFGKSGLFTSFIESGGPGHLVSGYPQFDGWPRYNSIVHQHMYIDWIKRAYMGGLRLMCALAVNNELLANEFGGQPPYDDVTVVERQIQEMKNFISRHSAWMEIAYAPADARRIIRQNKLAVVLAIEVDSLGNWKHETDCTNGDVQNYLRHVYNNLGVRMITPIHLANNALGGAAIATDMFAVLNRFLRNDYFQVEDGSRDGVQFRLGENEGLVAEFKRVFGKYDPPDYNKIPGGHVNALGLTPRGRFLIDTMMSLGMIIDVDHMSQKSTDETLDRAEKQDYPVVSSHTTFRELFWRRGETSDIHKLPIESNKTAKQVERIARLGGVIAPITNQGDIRSRGTKVSNDCGGSTKSWAQAYLYAVEKMGGKGVALGTDFNGLAGQPGPRFGPFAASGLKKKEKGLLENEDIRIRQRPNQLQAQTNGVRYNKPAQYYRTERWEPEDAYTNEQCDVWEAITLGRSRAHIDGADIRGNRGILDPVRLPGAVMWIKNIAKGIRANSDGELPVPSESDMLLNYNSARVQRGAYYAKTGEIPATYANDPGIRETFDKVRPIWQRVQQMEGNNSPLIRSLAGQRDFDINLDGLAHYGLLPDFIQDLKNVGLSDEDLAPLLRSAEDFIQMWEKCEKRKLSLPFPTWSLLPGLGKDIGVGADGSVWLIGTNRVGVAADFGVLKWNGTDWEGVDGGGVRIAVGPDGQPWLVNSVGQIFHRQGNSWGSPLPGLGKDIEVGADGSVWLIGTNRVGVAADFDVLKWNGTDWEGVDGGGVRIAVGPDGQPWLVNSVGQIFHRQGNSWGSPLPGLGKDIGVSADGSVWLIGTNRVGVAADFGVLKWNGTDWEGVDGEGVCIAVGPDGKPWMVNSIGQIYRRL